MADVCTKPQRAQGTAMRIHVRRSMNSRTTHHTLATNTSESASLIHGWRKGKPSTPSRVLGFRYEYSSRRMSAVSRQKMRKNAMMPR